jgi:hypothetical protein
MRIFGTEREEVTGRQKKLHVEEAFCDLFLNNIMAIKSKCMSLSRYVACMRNAKKIFIGKPVEKRSLRICKHGCDSVIHLSCASPQRF